MNGNDVLGMLHAFKRTRYFYGMKLTEGTFNRDQSYFNQKRWQMNRLGLGVGVLCGLELSMAEDGQILVSPGVAVDAYGREIVLPQPYCFENPRQPTDALGRPVGEPVEQGSVTLCIAYHECETDYVPVSSRTVTRARTAPPAASARWLASWWWKARPMASR